MPLRVLLADESSTIKKVFQLTLQDYAVEVKSVNVGLDVKAVAQQFKPDIIFADILLQQKSGYDVSAEMKSDKDFLRTPVVLMWSGFMDIDEDKFLASRADAKLEKPFEVERLRSLINQLVPKTKSQNLSRFLTFPKHPDFEEPRSAPLPAAKNPRNPAPPVLAQELHLVDPNQQEKEADWDMEQFAEMDEYTPQNTEQFSSVNLSAKMPQRSAAPVASDADLLQDDPEDKSEWVQNQNDNFRLNIPVDDNANADEDEMLVDSLVVNNKILEEDHRRSAPQKTAAPDFENDLELEEPVAQAPMIPNLTEEQLIDIIKAQSKDIIEKVVWRVVPEIATQIIERELKRLLDSKLL